VRNPFLSGFLGMKIATYANARTTLVVMKGKRKVHGFSLGCKLGRNEN
jgi:hypothetical protein